MLYIPRIEIIQFNVKITEAIVIRLKPTYIGLRLILYNPFVFKDVFLIGSPSLVDFPRSRMLKKEIIKPGKNITKASEVIISDSFKFP